MDYEHLLAETDQGTADAAVEQIREQSRDTLEIIMNKLYDQGLLRYLLLSKAHRVAYAAQFLDALSVTPDDVLLREEEE